MVGRRRASSIAFGAEVGWPLVIKASSGGYDGKGVWTVGSRAEAEPVVRELLDAAITAAGRGAGRHAARAGGGRGPFAVRAGRGVAGRRDRAARRHLRRGDRARRPDLDDELAEHAEALALRIAAELGVVGVLAVELFEND